MTLMRPFLIGLSILMLVIGGTFLTLYLIGRKKLMKPTEEQIRNQKLNLYLSMLILAGAILVGICIFLIY